MHARGSLDLVLEKIRGLAGICTPQPIRLVGCSYAAILGGQLCMMNSTTNFRNEATLEWLQAQSKSKNGSQCGSWHPRPSSVTERVRGTCIAISLFRRIRHCRIRWSGGVVASSTINEAHLAVSQISVSFTYRSRRTETNNCAV